MSDKKNEIIDAAIDRTFHDCDFGKYINAAISGLVDGLPDSISNFRKDNLGDAICELIAEAVSVTCAILSEDDLDRFDAMLYGIALVEHISNGNIRVKLAAAMGSEEVGSLKRLYEAAGVDVPENVNDSTMFMVERFHGMEFGNAEQFLEYVKEMSDEELELIRKSLEAGDGEIAWNEPEPTIEDRLRSAGIL